LIVFTASACSRLDGRGGFESETILQPQATEERARIIDRLVPEDTPISRTRLAAVAEATATVIKDIDRDRFPRVAKWCEKRAARCELAGPETNRVDSARDRKKKKTRWRGLRLTSGLVKPAAAGLGHYWILDLARVFAALILEQVINFFRGERQLKKANTDRIGDGVGNGGGRSVVGKFADRLGIHWPDTAVGVH